MALDSRLSSAAAAVEAFLDACLAEAANAGSPERLTAAMRHALLGGGKRFRPFLVLESAALFDVQAELAMPVAAALECIHSYSLVHDDLPAMDNDELRRGRPTVWKAFDEWTAILAGDGLLTLAFEIVAAPRCALAPALKAEIALALARAAGPAGMVGGQALDLAAGKLAMPARPALAEVRRLQAMKTGALILFAAEAGALIAGAGGEQRRALRAFGEHLGLAFQISDDLIDAEGSALEAGKATGKDAAQGKATLVALLGVSAARQALMAAEADAIRALAPFGDRAGTLAAAATFVARRTR
jgi:farnesyl diphosphate synthase